MEWTEENTLLLIDAIHEHDNLWNPSNKSKMNRLKKEDSFKKVALLFPPATSKEVKLKWQSLCQSYRVYRRKVESSKRSGAGVADVYKPCWFAFHALDSFMKATYQPQNTLDAGSNDQNDWHVEEEMNEDDPDAIVQEGEQLGERTQNEQLLGNQTQDLGSQPPRKIFKSPMKVKRGLFKKKQLQEEAVNVACEYLKKKSQEINPSPTPRVTHDECSIFGQLIAEKLRKMENNRRQYAMNDINNIMFKYVIENPISPVLPLSPLYSSPSPVYASPSPTFSPNNSPSYSAYLPPSSPFPTFSTSQPPPNTSTIDLDFTNSN